MNPPPPMPHDCGRATLSAKTVVAAASTALPPTSRIPRPTRAAAGDSVAMTPSVPVTPGWNCEPCFARAGTAATPSRAAARRMTVRRTAGVLPHRHARVHTVHAAGQPRAEDHPGDEPGDGGQDVRDGLVAQHASEARPVLDVAGPRRGERVDDGHRHARREA